VAGTRGGHDEELAACPGRRLRGGVERVKLEIAASVKARLGTEIAPGYEVRRAMRCGAWLLLAAVLAQGCATPARISIPSLADGVPRLDAYLFRPQGEGRRAAVVFLHGCGGLFSGSTGQMQPREVDWAERLVAQGYVVLAVDSFSPRGIKEMCSPRSFQTSVYTERPRDAYGALRYLQAQPFVRPDRIAVMGWSQGGGVIMLSVRVESLGRPAELPHGDFRAAIAFYPGSCRDGAHRVPWRSTLPVLVLVGADDNWTPAAPCKTLVEGAARRGSDIRIHVYPGAYHDFDWPNMAPRLLAGYTTSAGVVPMVGTNTAAREDAQRRVMEFLAQHLRD
jgi:dienelactone hydrolase